MSEAFGVLILTHGRPDRVVTVGTLRRCGYTGPIYLVLDNLDKTADQYRERYAGQEGVEVVVFDKHEAAKITDTATQGDLRGVVYARNAAWGVAESLGLTSFVVLDDDYHTFTWRYNADLEYEAKGSPRNLDGVFAAMVEFLRATPVHTIAMAQGGDFIGGQLGKWAKGVQARRKAMNSFVCLTDRPFRFMGRINEDVNAYAYGGSQGLLMLTTNQVSLAQAMTQQSKGGLTELYLDAGTYVKSYYTVLFQPSSAHVAFNFHGGSPGETPYPRLHHTVKWRHTVPKIVPEALRK